MIILQLLAGICLNKETKTYFKRNNSILLFIFFDIFIFILFSLEYLLGH